MEDLTSPQLEKAGQSISHAQNTKFFNQFIEQVENGEQKVAAILDACEAEAQKAKPPPENSGQVLVALIWGNGCEDAVLI